MFTISPRREDLEGRHAEPDDIKEPARDLLRYDYCTVLDHWRALALHVPILDRPDNMAGISSTQHNLDLVASFIQRVRHNEVDAPTRGLRLLALKDRQLTQPQERWVCRDLLLKPDFAEPE